MKTAIERHLQLKKNLDKAKEEIAEGKGALDQLFKRMKKEEGVATITEAEKLKAKLESELKKLEAEGDSQMKRMEKQDWYKELMKEE